MWELICQIPIGKQSVRSLIGQARFSHRNSSSTQNPIMPVNSLKSVLNGAQANRVLS